MSSFVEKMWEGRIDLLQTEGETDLTLVPFHRRNKEKGANRRGLVKVPSHLVVVCLRLVSCHLSSVTSSLVDLVRISSTALACFILAPRKAGVKYLRF